MDEENKELSDKIKQGLNDIDKEYKAFDSLFYNELFDVILFYYPELKSELKHVFAELDEIIHSFSYQIWSTWNTIEEKNNTYSDNRLGLELEAIQNNYLKKYVEEKTDFIASDSDVFQYFDKKLNNLLHRNFEELIHASVKKTIGQVYPVENIKGDSLRLLDKYTLMNCWGFLYRFYELCNTKLSNPFPL